MVVCVWEAAWSRSGNGGASSAVGVPTVSGHSMGVVAGGADDIGAAVACSPRQAQLALNTRRVGYRHADPRRQRSTTMTAAVDSQDTFGSHQLWLRTVVRTQERQPRRTNPYQHCCRCRMIHSIPRLGTWFLRIKRRCLKTSRTWAGRGFIR